MKKIIYLSLFFSYTAYAQVNKAKEIINEYINVIGGSDKCKTINSISYEVEATSYPDTSIKSYTKYIKLRPNKFYKKINVQEKQLEMRFDGENIHTEKVGEIGVVGDEFSNLKESYLFDFDMYSHPFVSIEYVGIDKFDEKLCNKIGVFFKEKLMYFEFFSIESKLLIGKVTANDFSSKKNVSLKTFYKTYISLDGILFCNSIETSWNDITITKSIMKKVKLNPNVSELIFKE